jgi:TPR repeat protein
MKWTRLITLSLAALLTFSSMASVFNQILKAAEQGGIDAQSTLGSMYRVGKGVKQDSKQAAYWFTKAAEQGNTNSQELIGIMYYQGEGVIQDYNKAFYWLTKAAEHGYTSSQGLIGVMYYQGKGVIQNNKMAYIWLAIAASKAGGETIKIRDIVAKRLTAKEIGEAQEEAIKLDNEINSAKN